MSYTSILRIIPLLVLVAGLRAQTEHILIHTAKPYGAIVRAIQDRGGQVTLQFQNFDGLAVEAPRSQLDAITALAGGGSISKDLLVAAPVSIDSTAGRGLARTGDENRIFADSFQTLSGVDIADIAGALPQGYLQNAVTANAIPLLAAGINGQGVIVALIDSGIRPGFPHISLDGTVIGCEDLVGDALGCMNSGNDGHGTFVAGMISANVVFTVASGAFRAAVLAECPGCFSDPPANTRIPMLGTAPLSSIYALRIFGPFGGAPTSRILAAIDRVIELRKKYDAGQQGGVNIKVANMSFGGSVLAAGSEISNGAITSLINNDILPVIAGGNAGPASLTIGTPGSALAAVTVAAASLAHNERIVERLQFGPTLGPLVRPFLGAQTAWFSSRGPNADGRIDPDVSANGFGSFGMGYGAASQLAFGSGTSFCTPTVSGVAALLRQAAPGATARQVRNAIIAAANPSLFADGSGVLDRGAGYVDALAARNLLATGTVPDSIPSPGNPNSNVKVNIEMNTSLKVNSGFVRQSVADLKPGQRSDILYEVAPNTRQVVVTLSHVTPALPPAAQNQLFGDDIFLAVHTAKTSAIGDAGDYRFQKFGLGGTFTVTDPETGIIRVTVSGDWTNAGTVSGEVSIFSVTDPLPQFTSQGKVVPAQNIVMPLTIPPGVSTAELQLSWREDWGSYPLNDIDLIVIGPDNRVYLDGVTLNSPERVVIQNPVAGQWTLLISPFEINTGSDKYELRIALDGNVVH